MSPVSYFVLFSFDLLRERFTVTIAGIETLSQKNVCEFKDRFGNFDLCFGA
jgi:hypothetical protein